jgi:hypothetical protein
MFNKAKLVTGEIISYKAYDSSSKDAFMPDTYPRMQYAGVGYFFSETELVQEKMYHFWVQKKNYSVFDLQKGDKVLTTYEGNLIWVIMSGLIGNTGAANMLRIDGTNINYPFRDIDILYVEEGNTGLPIIKSALAKEALLHGGFHLKNYIDTFGEIPLKKGDYIQPLDGYDRENNLLNIRNNHKVLNSGDLVFDSWARGNKYASVKSVGLNKTAFLAINSISVLKIV